jgi:hypothetical protein
MEVGKNSVIYMGLVPGPNEADNICGEMKVTGTMQRGATVYVISPLLHVSMANCHFQGDTPLFKT